MRIEECPVSIDELKQQLRRPVCSSAMDDSLSCSLLAAAEYIEKFCGRSFSDFEKENFPYQLKQAILMRAASYFENPTDMVTERITASEVLANPRQWRKEEEEITK